jgi:4-hydroxy-3-polyprenylbenzoate decarboxylase
MTYRSLRDFIAKLEASGELVRVREPVSTVLEMTEIQRRMIARGGPAIVFEQPLKADGSLSAIPVIVNLFGTVKRVAMWASCWPCCANPSRRAASARRSICCRSLERSWP